MRAGRLRHRVELQRPVVDAEAITDDHGVTTPLTPAAAFETVIMVYASIEATAGREGLTDKKVLAQSSHEIRMRDYPPLTPAWQIVYRNPGKDRIFRIVDVRRPAERSIELIVFADEQVL